jgi:Glycosyl-transferase for dystroglycan
MVLGGGYSSSFHRKYIKADYDSDEQDDETSIVEEEEDYYSDETATATTTTTTTLNPQQRLLLAPTVMRGSGRTRRRPFRERFLVSILLLGTGCLAGISIAMANIVSIIAAASSSSSSSSSSSTRRNTQDPYNDDISGGGSTTTTFDDNVIRKADQDELVKRLQALLGRDDEKQQDVIVNVFTPAVEQRQRQHSHHGNTSKLNSITCATQGSVNKLDRLLHLTSRWRGPVSFATLVSQESDLDLLFEFWNDNPLVQDYVTLHVLMEMPQLQRPENGRYPINQLRNLAMHNVATDYVFITDVDFIPSDHAHDEIAAIITTTPLQPKTFWILPAFERYKNATNLQLPEQDVVDVDMVPKTKAELIKAMQQDKVVTTFHHFFPRPHVPTNYEKWYTYNDTEESNAAMYPVVYDKWFEPYVVCKTQDLHDFFPAFRGYGRNKNTWFVEANLRNFSFHVLAHQFVVHMNHARRYARGQQDRSHLNAMLAAWLKYVKNKYNMPEEESFYF